MQRRKYPEQTALPGARSLSLDRVREDLTKVSKENNLELFQEFKKHDDVANQVIRSLFPNRKLFSVEEKIFDQDDQVQIQLSRIYPYHAVAQLRLLFPEDNYIGTGWLAGPKTLITVGHNLFDSDERQAGSSPSWANSVEISPGRFEEQFFGYGPYICTDGMHVTEVWKQNALAGGQDIVRDLGCLQLSQPVNTSLKSLPTKVLSDEELREAEFTVCGYPNYPTHNPDQDGRRQWSCSGKLTNISATHLFYRLDTWGGESGSPLWVNDADGPKVVGIHMGGDEQTSNWAVRITADVEQLINKWIGES